LAFYETSNLTNNHKKYELRIMFIQDYMTAIPVTATSDIMVVDAMEILGANPFRHLPIVDGGGVILGIVTDRDLRSAWPSSLMSEEERKQGMALLNRTPVETVMSRDVTVIRSDSTIDAALLLFESRGVGALPVVDRQNRVVGIFSLKDMMAGYRRLFGLGEKGSALICIEDNGETLMLSNLVKVLAENKILFTRLIRKGKKGRRPAMVYLRICSINISFVRKVIEEAGFAIYNPAIGG
jgi:acetoin utilization protein AcuB